MLHCHRVGLGRCNVRVHELATELQLPVYRILVELRTRGEHIATHLSTVPDRFVRELRPLHPVSGRAADHPQAPPEELVVEEAREPRTVSYPPNPRRKPGPKPVVLDGFYFDEYDRVFASRRDGEASVREVACALGIDRSTVRKWAQRGHLEPVRFERDAMVFRVSDVVAARDLIRERTLEVPGLKANIPPFHDNVVTIADAAKAAHVVQPATIRSWIHRGHITPMNPGSRPTLLRGGDVFQVARGAKRASKYPGR